MQAVCSVDLKHMSWVDTMMSIYWELRPCYETQMLYKSNNLLAFDYWNMELTYLTCSSWAKTEEFKALPNITYLLEKYTGEKIKLDAADRRALGTAFLIDLGMNPETFPVKIP